MTDKNVLPADFYARDGLTFARELVGKTLVHRVDGCELCGIITETEAYMGVTDPASHAFGGRMTERTKTMYLRGGFAYVYRIYGIYLCMNITAGAEGSAEAVLIRGVMPLCGTEEMYARYRKYSRKKNLPDTAENMSTADLYRCTSGPGKLCIAMGITMSENRADMTSDGFFVRDDGYAPAKLLASPRIGIDYAGEAAFWPWRFHAAEESGVPVFLR